MYACVSEMHMVNARAITISETKGQFEGEQEGYMGGLGKERKGRNIIIKLYSQK